MTCCFLHRWARRVKGGPLIDYSLSKPPSMRLDKLQNSKSCPLPEAKKFKKRNAFSRQKASFHF